MIDKRPLTEVRYYQTPFDASFHLAPVDIDSDNPPVDWTYLKLDDDIPAAHSRKPVRAVACSYRLKRDVVQMLYLDVHRPPIGYVPQADDPGVALLEKMKAIEPIDCSYFNQCGCSASVGYCPETSWYYVRADAWKTFAIFDHLDDLLREIDLDIVLPAGWDDSFSPNEEWWVVLFEKVTQSALQDAHDRLDVLVQWRYQMDNLMKKAGEREVKRRVKEVTEKGWKTVIAELRQAEAKTRADVIKVLQAEREADASS